MLSRHAALALAAFALAACKTKEPAGPVPVPVPTPHASDAPATSSTAGPDAPPEAWQPDRSCQRDDECVPAPGCCPAPCTSLVIHRKDAEEAEKRLVCDRTEPCPSAGGCLTHQYLCVRGQCELVYESSPDYRPRAP